MEGHKEHVSVFWEGHLRIGNFAVGGGKVTAVRQRGEGHGNAPCIDLGGADSLPASLHPHVVAFSGPGPIGVGTAGSAAAVSVIIQGHPLLIVDQVQRNVFHMGEARYAVDAVGAAGDHFNAGLSFNVAV